jgi:hypothetical protein
MAVGGVALVGIVIAIVAMSGKDEPEGTTVAQQPPGAAPAAVQPKETGTTPPAATPPVEAAPGEPAAPPAEAPGEPTPEEPKSPEGGEGKKPTRLGDLPKKRADGTSRYDPPATLGHLETTPPELRKQIDECVAMLLDPQAGRESHEAKAKLAAIGKPAFLPLLGAMAKVRDTISDNDSMEERLIESSLMLADQCLREMDGFLDSHAKGVIRPGTDKKYLAYVMRMHYKRWDEVLKDMPEMPGPFDASKAPAEEGGAEEEEEEK